MYACTSKVLSNVDIKLTSSINVLAHINRHSFVDDETIIKLLSDIKDKKMVS